MKKGPRLKHLVIAAVPVLALSPMSLVATQISGRTGASVWVIRLVFVLLGVIAGAIIYWFLGRREEDGDAIPDSGSEDMAIDGVISNARKRLSSAKGAGRVAFGELPLFLVMGPTGSTKTTSILRSGMEPELLAGEIRHGGEVVPTPGANVWHSHGALWVEAGGPVLDDAARWKRLIQLLHPRRLGAVFSRGGQAPRMAVVCVSCEDLMGAAGTERSQALARTLRTRLVETSRSFGIRLPVYVLFTKADRIPHFDDFVVHFTNDEARRVLGATLPLSPDTDIGTYADGQFRRLDHAFGRISNSLALKRLKYLPRDSDTERATRAYEFPRELHKLRGSALSFMVELCRPSELEVSPFLRGFYFTGVRPITVQDGGLGAAPVTTSRNVPVDATRVFDAMAVQQAAAAPPSAGTSRRIPQWVFLERTLRDVLLKDTVSQTIASGGSQITVWRRRLLTAAAAITVLFSLGQVVSWANNRSMQARVSQSVQGLQTVVLDGSNTATLPVLSRLDSLRAELTTLAEWEREGPPFFHRFGLYSGSRLYQTGRPLYFSAFNRVLFSRAEERLTASLASLPSTPSEEDNYDETYDNLKAYLITTLHPDRSTPEFLAPVLLGHWRGSETVESERSEIARRQLEFYASELPVANPFPNLEADGTHVSHARSFLLEFGQAESFLRGLVADADQVGDPVRLSSQIVTDSVTVPAAFTREGWAYVQSRIANPDSLLSTEEWVLGEGAAVPDPASLTQSLDAMYQAEFGDRWTRFVRAASVRPFDDAADAGAKLTLLADSDSPIAELVLSTSENTAAASTSVSQRFQPAFVLAPPDSTGNVQLSDGARGYLLTLSAIGAAMTSVATAPPEGQEAAAQQVRTQLQAAQQTVLDLTQAFDSRTRETAPVAAALQRLLREPLDRSEAVLELVQGEISQNPIREMNQRAQPLCREFDRLVTFFPFRNDQGARDASPEDVASALQPGSSALWNTYEQALQDVLERRGSRYVARADSPYDIDPGFVNFFNQAASVSSALYRDGGEAPAFEASFRPRFSSRLSELTIVVDGTTTRFSPTSNRTLVLSWDGTPSEIRMVGRVDGVERTLFGPASGTWSLLRFLLAAEEWTQEGSRYLAEWSMQVDGAADLKLEADVEAPAALADGTFSALRCPGRIVR